MGFTTRAFAASEWRAARSTDSQPMCGAADRSRFAATITDGERAHEIASGKLEGFDGNWKKYETVIRANATAQHAQLNFYVDDKGYVDLDMVSLFPVDTWKGRPNGLRKDLVQLLYDMHPGFRALSRAGALWRGGS